MSKGGAVTTARCPFRYALLVWCLVLHTGSLLAAPKAPEVYIGSKVAPCAPSPILQDGEVYLPVTFRYAGLPVTVFAEGETVVVRGPGQLEGCLPALQHQGTLYYPVNRACAALRLSARWDEKANRLSIAPRVDAIRPEMFDRLMTLRILAGYPLTARLELERNPGQLIIEIAEAHLFNDSTLIPVNQGGITRIRATQVSYQPCLVRITVEAEAMPQYRALSARATTEICLRLGVPENNTPEAYTVLDRLLDAPGSELTGLAVTGIDVGTSEEGNPLVVVRTNGPAQAKVLRLGSPPRVALDIENATIQAQAPAVPPHTPLVQRVRLGQFTEKVARVVVDLVEEAECVLTQGHEPGTLVLTLRSALSRVQVAGLKGLKVMVDPGHGGSLSGTTGLSGRREQDINLDIAKRLYRLLEAAGAKPTMTRYGDDTVGLRARPAMANSQGVHIFISIHCNANGRPNSARGIETYYCHQHSYRLARTLHYRLVKELGAPDRQVRRRPGLVVTRETKMPSVLLEIGYMNHREEDRLLGTPEYRQRAARAIFNGIAEYVGASTTAAPVAAEEAALAVEELEDAVVIEEGEAAATVEEQEGQ